MNAKQVIARVKAILTETEEGTATAEDLNISINEALNVIGHYEKVQAAFYPEKYKSYSGQALKNLSSFDGSIFLGWTLNITLKHEQDFIAFICKSWDPDKKEWEGIDNLAAKRAISLDEIESLTVTRGGR